MLLIVSCSVGEIITASYEYREYSKSRNAVAAEDNKKEIID